MLAGLSCVQGAMPKRLYLWWSFLAYARSVSWERDHVCLGPCCTVSGMKQLLVKYLWLEWTPLILCLPHPEIFLWERWLSQLSVSSSVMGGCPKEHRRETELCLNEWVQSGGLPVGGHPRAAVYLWLIHVEVWQKTAKFCKAIILQ